ncbi:MAG TPA: MFS transporter [Thermoanaerobaculia bacterium]|nr:MFS transporter [Thermoanaerobaculia bacterium]
MSHSPVPPPVRRREIVGWALFDFANSSYTTVIVTVAFSVYFTKLVAAGPGADRLWGLGITASNLIVVLLSPLLGAAADETGRKKLFLFATYALCVAGTAGLWYVRPGAIALGLLLFVVSNVAFSLGENLVGAFLPEISTPANVGRISGFGWGLGYLGGLASLLAVRPLLRAGFTVENLAGLRLVWPVTAGFFLIAALPTFLFLRERAPRRSHPFATSLRLGFGRLHETARALRHFSGLVRFLVVFFVYSAGLMSVIAFVGVYAERTVGFTPDELILLFLLVQISSAAGAIVFGFLQDRLGARATIQITLLLWIAVCALVWASTGKGVFWGVALFAGLGIGSLQSASRALVGLFSPVEKSGEFFAFWGLAGKGAYAFGPAVFGLISSATGSQKTAILATAVFFLLGFAGMFGIDERRGRAAAEAWNAAHSG